MACKASHCHVKEHLLGAENTGKQRNKLEFGAGRLIKSMTNICSDFTKSMPSVLCILLPLATATIPGGGAFIVLLFGSGN